MTKANSMKKNLIFLYVFVVSIGILHALDPLEEVERDQTDETQSSDDILNRNIAWKRMDHYTHASSYRTGKFALHAHDGDHKTAWILGKNQTEANLKIAWGLAVPINEINVIESHATAIESLLVELYDGMRWEVLHPNLVEDRGRFSFPPRPASALRISIKTNGQQAGITEVEVFNTQSSEPLRQYGSAELVDALVTTGAVVLFEGSPYLYTRKGRDLIRPKYADTSLTDTWTEAVLESIVTHLGGAVAMAKADQATVSLNGRTFSMKSVKDTKVIVQIEAMAEKAGLEFMRCGPLVAVGKGLKALNSDGVVSELKKTLGLNPYLIQVASKPQADVIVTPTLNPKGTTYQWAGFRTTYYPDTNAAAWYKYSETKVIRSWVNASASLSRYVIPPERVTTIEHFEAYKNQVRSNPEKAFMERFHGKLYDEFSMYNRLGIEVINQTGPKHWPDTLHDDLIQWVATYALTYHLAKNHGVAAHQFGNEPDPYFNKSTDEQIARRLTLVADAVHCAIEDVNRYANRNLKSIFAAPVLASDFQGRSARIMMRNLHTRYDGSMSPTPLFQLFNRHRYGGRPHQNALEVRQGKQMMKEEAGAVLPQVFTELNYSTGRNWGRAATTFTNDTPTVFSSIASIWGSMMHEQGVYGVFVFKLDDPTAWLRKDVGPFSNVVTYSMKPEQDPGAKAKMIQQISYGTKNFEVCRLFGKGFHGSRPLLLTDIACSDSEYRSWTTFDEDKGRFYIWSVQANDLDSYEVEFDLSKIDLPPGALITAEQVSGALHGEMTHVLNLPADRRIRIQQAPESAILLTVHQRPLTHKTIDPVTDSMVMQGGNSKRNYGSEAQLEVGRHSDSDQNKISFLTFGLPEGERLVQRAVLELHGHSQNVHAYDGGFLFRIYAIDDGEWDEQTLTAENAPNMNRTVSALQKIDENNYPVGHVTAYNKVSSLRIDVTRAIQEAQKKHRKALRFTMIRELHWPGENTDNFSASLSSREAGDNLAPKLHLWE
jgi:hypothetical protein